eukprot:1336103-Karenia_brevis.AAC.1
MLRMKVVTDMVALGTKFDNLGSPNVTVDHRFNLATKSFWAVKHRMTAGVPLKTKLETLARIPDSVLSFDSGNWMLDKDLLTRIKRWEFHNIRIGCRLRWKSGTEG